MEEQPAEIIAMDIGNMTNEVQDMKCNEGGRVGNSWPLSLTLNAMSLMQCM